MSVTVLFTAQQPNEKVHSGLQGVFLPEIKGER